MSKTLEERKKDIYDWFKINYSIGQADCLKEALAIGPVDIEDDGAPMPPYLDTIAPRLVMFLGMPSIHYLERFVESQKIEKPTVMRVLVVEQDPRKVAHLIFHPKFASFVTSKSFKFILSPGKENCKSFLFNVLKQPEFSQIMELCQQFITKDLPDEIKSVYEFMANSYVEVMGHVYHNYGRIDDSLEGVRATLLNKKDVVSNHGILDLKGRGKGMAAALVAAGPTLDAVIEDLKQVKDTLVIFAADAAVKPLLKAGITPHFTTSIERGNIYQKPFWEGLPPISTQLVYYPVVHPEVLSLYPGPKRTVYRNYSYYAYFEYSFPKGMLLSGGSTSHLANRLINYMGFDKLILIGIDNAYEKHTKENTYRSHCNGLGYSDWATYHPIEFFSKEKNHAPAYQVEATDGTMVMTNTTYHQWAKEFAEEVNILGLHGKMMTATPKGVNIPGVTYMPLKEFCASLKPIEVVDFTPKTNPKVRRAWDNSYLLQSVQGYLKNLKFVLDIVDFIRPCEKNRKVYIASIMQFLQHKFTSDHLFISFVVQNCAAEYYKSENKWYSFPLDIELDYEKRLEVIEERVKLFTSVLSKLENILIETEK